MLRVQDLTVESGRGEEKSGLWVSAEAVVPTRKPRKFPAIRRRKDFEITWPASGSGGGALCGGDIVAFALDSFSHSEWLPWRRGKFPAIKRELDRVSEVLARSRSAFLCQFGMFCNSPEIWRGQA